MRGVKQESAILSIDLYYVAMGSRGGGRETGQEAIVMAQVTAMQARVVKRTDLRSLLKAGHQTQKPVLTRLSHVCKRTCGLRSR